MNDALPAKNAETAANTVIAITGGNAILAAINSSLNNPIPAYVMTPFTNALVATHKKANSELGSDVIIEHFTPKSLQKLDKYKLKE